MKMSSRALFALTILCGSFLLFLVQPLVARLALPLLGGAPAVWNSAMLVYQTLLLAGYAYAHLLSRVPLRRQIAAHLALLLLAALFLPVGLADIPGRAAGWEVLWVPALVLASVGPLFVLVAAQAPLLQRWYALDDDAGDPYWLYAASNLGSFTGLLAYPLILEPLLSTDGQALVWSLGYGVLVILMGIVAAFRWKTRAQAAPLAVTSPAPGWKRVALWLALSAVPSGLLLSTTTHLSTDLVAMPLLWVIPLGIYLLSFVFAFNPASTFAVVFARTAPTVLLLVGAMAMVSRGTGNLNVAIAAVLLLLILATALHRRLFELRPEPDRLTFFYLVMSAGGALGGVFAALVAPVVFDWVWEHPLLVLAAGALLPARPLIAWMDRMGWGPARQRRMRLLIVAAAAALGAWMQAALIGEDTVTVYLLTLAMTVLGILVLGSRWALLTILALLMFSRGGFETVRMSIEGVRDRSYFGVYTIREETQRGYRTLLHGTTLHGRQFYDADRRQDPTSYYGPGSGAGLALRAAPRMYGDAARIGVVGMGTGTLLCYRQPGQSWTMYEIDPKVVEYSDQGVFTFRRDCAPDSRVVIGDARLELASEPGSSFNVLVVDAFSSDAIPLHLLTREALATYADTLTPDGLLVLHISNRFVDLRPVIAAHARDFGWTAMLRNDPGDPAAATTSSLWVVMASDPQSIASLLAFDPQAGWHALDAPARRAWTDDHASILPYLLWDNMIGSGE